MTPDDGLKIGFFYSYKSYSVAAPSVGGAPTGIKMCPTPKNLSPYTAIILRLALLFFFLICKENDPKGYGESFWYLKLV